MRAVLLLLLLITLITIKTVAGGKHKKERAKPPQSGSGCTDWRYGNCVPSNGDCGSGFREGSCDQQTRKMKCRVPCIEKKNPSELMAGDSAGCKYRFSRWGECDPNSHTQTKTGTLKKDLNNGGCEPVVTHSRPCLQNHEKKNKRKNKGKKRKGKGH